MKSAHRQLVLAAVLVALPFLVWRPSLALALWAAALAALLGFDSLLRFQRRKVMAIRLNAVLDRMDAEMKRLRTELAASASWIAEQKREQNQKALNQAFVAKR